MERRWNPGIAIGAGIGALLGAVLFDYLLAFEPGGFRVGVGGAMIGATLGAVLGWVLSRPRPAVEEVLGSTRPTTSIRIVMWVSTVGAIAIAVRAGIGGELVEALGWLALAGAWTLHASGAIERARALSYLSGGVLLLGFLFLGIAFILGEL
jgi:hypothetical protein